MAKDVPTALRLSVLPERLAVCRLAPDVAVPAWATGGSLGAITRTAAELSIVCSDATVPADIVAERGWRALMVAGPLDFGLTGVLAALAVPLAAAGIPIFVISTYDTDYVLVKQTQLVAAVAALTTAGMQIEHVPL